MHGWLSEEIGRAGFPWKLLGTSGREASFREVPTDHSVQYFYRWSVDQYCLMSLQAADSMLKGSRLSLITLFMSNMQSIAVSELQVCMSDM